MTIDDGDLQLLQHTRSVQYLLFHRNVFMSVIVNYDGHCNIYHSVV
jgi:hypothetical protein